MGSAFRAWWSGPTSSSAGGGKAIVIGDAVWDALSAEAAGVPCIGLRSGGISAERLGSAGASWVHDGPRDLFDHLGGFDEAYRLHAEDLDLCRRVREAGGVVAIANDLRVTHVRGVSSRSRPLETRYSPR